ncbi:MAG: sulfotransferase domain-containing protein [Candidatus Wallbacteria bacterium]|nr:sulfotransferase domain-containing protein [Candidatus Wallbacteria bacterium]
MARLVWLASYPKSGNTWMRALIANFTADAPAPASINALGPLLGSGAREPFDEWAGVKASHLPSSLVDRLRPEVYRCVARSEKDNVYVKVHDAWRLTPSGEPLFPADVTHGVEYIVRNPLDLVASNAHHAGVDLVTAAEQLCDPEYTLARPEQGLPSQLPQKTLCWSGHVRSWLDLSPLPVHLVRYEDLHRDTPGTLAGVVRFCGLEPEPARIRKAVAFSEFSELSRQERERGFRERRPNSTAEFFRKGQIGSWTEELPSELARRVVDAHHDTMERFGYLEQAAVPVGP